MSIKTTTSIDVEVDATEITTTPSEDVVASNQHTLHVRNLDSIISGSKQEYSIVGDGFYASVGADEAPEWLTSIIDTVVEESVRSGFVDYNNLVEDVRSAVDSIDIAENTYVKTINFNTLADGRIGSVVETLNTRIDNVESTIIDVDTVQSTADSAVATRISDIRAEFDDNESRITGIEIAYASADQILANSINSLSGRLDSQDGTLSGTADAIEGLRTYVGLTDFNDPNGTGMLARVQVLENQNDGVIEYTTGTYDVMTGVSPGDSNLDDDELDVAAEPYATWIATDTTNSDEAERSAHVGDVYIQYDETTGNYVKSYKFIKTAQDTTTPLATDAQGYTWALVTDTDSQSAYVAALNAADLADQKRRVFVATPFAPYDIGDLWVDTSTSPKTIKSATAARSNTYNAEDWAVADEQAQYFIDNTYEPDKASIDNQLDGQIEYFFFESYDSEVPIDVSAATSESGALAIIKTAWDTAELQEEAHGNVFYFKDSKNAYWYASQENAFRTVVDTSIYEALQDAATAQGAADGKVSQFYAWGGENAPADYDIVVEPAYTDEDANEVPAVTTTVSGASFLYWFKSTNVLYYKLSDAWTVVPTTAGTGNVYVAEGDIVTVFDPTDGDISNYSYNGTAWQRTGPNGIISQSSYFLDLDTAVRGPNGVAQGLVDLNISSQAYTNTAVTGVTNKFAYDSAIYLNGAYYKSGFGMNTVGVVQNEGSTADGTTPEAAFDSEFYVNAERFVLKSPSYPALEAVFQVTATGISLGLEHTEATKNEPKGTYTSSEDYTKGDMIEYNGSSYVALKSFSDIAPDTPQVTDPLDTDYPYWQLLASKGTSPDALTVTPSYNAETGVTTLSFSDGSSAAISDGTNADALTVSASTVNGITTLSFSDGTSATVNDGTSSGVKVIYADDANGTNATFTNSSQAYVNYYEWTESAPTEVPTGLTYTKIVGENGDAEGVKPIYADDATGTNATFTFSNQEFVNFYEWSTTAPTAVPSSLTYVRFKGEERGVKVIYADTAAGGNASFTDNSKLYVNYYEWVGAEPTEIPSGLTYVKFKGENGDSEGVISVYADDANGTNATLVFNNQKFVNFYEWTNSPPTVAPEGLTYVKFVGTDADTYKEIFIYANSINAPTLPTSTAGYFNTSTGVVATPAGETTWSTSASTPSSGKFTWRSSLTIVDENSDSSWAASDTAWNAAVKLTGDQGTSITGPRGTATLTHNASDLGDAEPGDAGTIAKIAGYWDTAAPAAYAGEITGDTLILNNTDTAAGWTHIYEYSGTVWVATSTFTVNGNQVINGTLAAEAIGSGSFRSTSLSGTRPVVANDYTGTIMDTKGVSVYNNGQIRVRLGDLSPDT